MVILEAYPHHSYGHSGGISPPFLWSFWRHIPTILRVILEAYPHHSDGHSRGISPPFLWSFWRHIPTILMVILEAYPHHSYGRSGTLIKCSVCPEPQNLTDGHVPKSTPEWFARSRRSFRYWYAVRIAIVNWINIH